MDAVHREIMEEKAGALLRTERRLLDALAAYCEQSGASKRAADLMWDVVDASRRSSCSARRVACATPSTYSSFTMCRARSSRGSAFAALRL